MTDLARIKNNVAKMVAMNAPESDIDGYIASEGVTVDDVKNYQSLDKDVLGAVTTFDKGYTGGFGRKLGGVMNAIGAAPVDALLGDKKFSEAFADRYNEIVNPALEASEKFEGANPKTALALNIGGAVVSPINKLGAGYINKGATTLNKLARSSGVGAGIGSVYGAGRTENLEDLATNVAEDAQMGAAFGVAAPIAIQGLKSVVSKIRPQNALVGKATGLEAAIKDGDSVKMLKRGIQADDDIANQIKEEAPVAMNSLNERMRNALNRLTGRKLDIDQANVNQQNRYNEFIGENADMNLFDATAGKKNVADNANAVYNNMNGEENVLRQIQNNGSRGQVRLQQEQTPRSFVNSAAEEKSAALGELVEYGHNSRGTPQNGVFISRNDGARKSFVVNPKTEGLFDKANISKADYVQLNNSTEDAQVFYDAITRAKEALGDVGEQVYVYPVEEYQSMKMFLSRDGLSGIAVKPDGDIVSVFVNPKAKLADLVGGRSHGMLELAKQNGGTKLDAFDTFLPKLYAKHGFKVVGRDKWNEMYKPDKWNKEFFKNWNNGEPDVVYMQYEAPAVRQNISSLPRLSAYTQNLNAFQKDALNQALSKGAYMSSNAKGSLGATHRGQEVLNDMIEASYDTSIIGQKKPTTETRQLMQVKEVLNQILEPSGVKPFDTSLSKAKALQDAYEKGYKFKPSETKFEALGLDKARDKRAFLQGRIASILDNVKEDKNIAKAIQADENTLRKLMPEGQYRKLLKEANQISTEYERVRSLAGQAEKQMVRPEPAGRPMSEITETRGAIKGSLLDALNRILMTESNKKAANILLGNEKAVRSRLFDAIQKTPDYALTPYLVDVLSQNK